VKSRCLATSLQARRRGGRGRKAPQSEINGDAAVGLEETEVPIGGYVPLEHPMSLCGVPLRRINRFPDVAVVL
jgi:hypothetical protein